MDGVGENQGGLSGMSRLMSHALEQLSSLENSEKTREDAIRNGKAIIANWRTPSEFEINKIFDKMRRDLVEAE